MNKKEHHVVPSSDGGWDVKKMGLKELLVTSKRKKKP